MVSMNESDPRSDVHYLGSSENKAWKKISDDFHIFLNVKWLVITPLK